MSGSNDGANVLVQIAGSETIHKICASTVRQAKEKMSLNPSQYMASVDGVPRGDEYELSPFNFVTMAPNVKGGL